MAWPKCVGQTGAPVLDPTCERPEVKLLRPTHPEGDRQGQGSMGDLKQRVVHHTKSGAPNLPVKDGIITRAQKIAEGVTKAIMATANCAETSVSVGIEERRVRRLDRNGLQAGHHRQARHDPQEAGLQSALRAEHLGPLPRLGSRPSTTVIATSGLTMANVVVQLRCQKCGQRATSIALPENGAARAHGRMGA